MDGEWNRLGDGMNGLMGPIDNRYIRVWAWSVDVVGLRAIGHLTEEKSVEVTAESSLNGVRLM